MITAPAGIEFVTEGSWNVKASGGEWSPGGCGCGGSCEGNCKGNCGCGGSCGGQAKAPSLPDYDGEITAPGFYDASGGGAIGWSRDVGHNSSARPLLENRSPTWCSGFTCAVGGELVEGIKHPTRDEVCKGIECEECIPCDDATNEQTPCPGYCLWLARTIEEAISQMNNRSLSHNAFKAHYDFVKAAIPQYERTCGKIPTCPELTSQTYEEVTFCGPDVTNLLDEIMEDASLKCLLPVVSLPYFSARLLTDLNWKQTQENRCGSKQCENTLAICGRCVDHSVPANILYGYIYKRCGVRDWATRAGARAFAKGNWPAHDQAAVDLGIEIGEGIWRDRVTRNKLCEKIRASTSTIQPPDDPTCHNARPCATFPLPLHYYFTAR